MISKTQISEYETLVGPLFTIQVQRNGNAQVNFKNMKDTPNDQKLLAAADAYKALKAKGVDVEVQFGFVGKDGKQVTWLCLWINDTQRVEAKVDHHQALVDMFEKAIELDIDTSPTTQLPEAGQYAWLKRAIIKAQSVTTVTKPETETTDSTTEAEDDLPF